MMWAIRNKRTRKWLCGTDHRYSPAHQRTSKDNAMIFDSYELAQAEIRWRQCGRDYEAVPIRIEEVER